MLPADTMDRIRDLGDVWESPGGDVVLVNADCLEVLPLLERVDLVLTDPPYSEQTHRGARTRTVGANSNKLVDFDSIDPAQIIAAIRCNGWIVSTVDWHHMQAIEDTGRLVRFGVWVKPNGAPQLTGDRPATGWEAVAICWAGEGRKHWNGGGSRAVWTENRIDAEYHPTQKPVNLYRKWARLFGGEIILDPFMGSGTTGVACIREGRKFIGIELDPKYYEIAVKRCKDEIARTAMLDAVPSVEVKRQKELAI